jgi:hypothetical protein
MTARNDFRMLIGVAFVLGLLAAGCNQNQTTTGTTPSPDPAEETAFEVKATTVFAPLSQPYKQNADGSPGTPSESELPAPPNSVVALWYETDDTWVTIFKGLDADAPLCPGTSLQTVSGTFNYVSNSPTEEGACQRIQPSGIAKAPQGVRVCDGVAFYLTRIPVDEPGSLWASFQTTKDGASVGLTGAVKPGGTPPEIDPDASGYKLPEGFGKDQVSCT